MQTINQITLIESNSTPEFKLTSSIGKADIDQKDIDVVIQELVQYDQNIKNFSLNDYQSLITPFDFRSKITFLQQTHLIAPLKSEPPKYLSNLSHLILKLNNQITQMEIGSFEKVDIHLDKGEIPIPFVKYWHTDGSLTSVTISFSNIGHWNTRIVDKKLLVENFGEDFISSNLNSAKARYQSEETILKINEFGTSSLCGYFYNACETIHRSPNQSDSLQNLSSEHYRLFLRFRSK